MNRSTCTGLALALAFPFILGAPLKKGQEKDVLLFAIPLCNELFFAHNALLGRGKEIIPPPLKLFVASVALAATAAYGRAAGVIVVPSGKPPAMNIAYSPKKSWPKKAN